MSNGYETSSQKTDKNSKWEADYIVVGSGCVGGLVAGRLAEKFSVILLEFGDNDLANQDIYVPTGSTVGGLGSHRVNHYFMPMGHSLRDDELRNFYDDRFWPFSGGCTLGGGGSVNGMQHVWGTVDYYKRWYDLTGDPDWRPNRVMKRWKEMETFKNDTNLVFSSPNRSTNGPFRTRLTSLTDAKNGTSDVVASALASEYKVPVIKDFNDPTTPIGGFSAWNLAQSGDKDIPSVRRESSATAMFRDKLVARPGSNIYGGTGHLCNLTVITNARALRVAMPNKGGEVTATGVEVLVQGKCIFFSKKGVILSAGFTFLNSLALVIRQF